MKTKFRKMFSVMLAASAFGGSSLMADTSVEERINQLEATVKAQQNEISRLRTSAGDTWMTERRAEEIRTLVHEVLSDADTRASLAGDGAVAGHDGKSFFLASEDGKFRLNVNGQIQIRYTWNENSGPKGDGIVDQVDNTETGFENRRTKLFFHGHVGDPRFQYVVSLMTLTDDNHDGSVWTDEIYAKYALSDGVTVWAGRTKAPFTREEIMDSRYTMAADRSLVNEVFNIGRVEGIGVILTPSDMIKVNLAVTDGGSSGEPGSLHNFTADNTDVPALTGRIDLKLAGGWNDWNDYSSWSNAPASAFIGAAVHWERAEVGNDGADAPDGFYSYTLDATFKSGGFSAFAAFVGQHVDGRGATGPNDEGDADGYGVVVQVGYMVIPDKLEPFVRYEWLDLDEIGNTSNHEIQLITVGTNYYMNKHQSKVTVDFQWAVDPIAIPANYSANLGDLGLRSDDFGGGNRQDDQFVIRAQFQLLF